MKKNLLLVVAAVFALTAIFTLNSCKKDEPSDVETFAMKSEIAFENFSDEEKAVFQGLIDLTKKVSVGDYTLVNAKTVVYNSAQQMKSKFAELVPAFGDGQKITYTINLYKGSTATGTPVYSQSIVTTKDGAVIK
ncbi:MAG: hypothetical protein HUK12_03260 [Muribaculaceae bacterium]|nr:hypothetical protein [Muribaculaceae bacterium]